MKVINTTKPYVFPEELPERERRFKDGVIVDQPETDAESVKPDEAYTPQAEDLDLIQL